MCQLITKILSNAPTREFVLGTRTRAFPSSFLTVFFPSSLFPPPLSLFPSFGNWSVIDIQKAVCV